MTSHSPPGVCPFCGLATAYPHESQEGCIQALQAEIDRMRHVLDQVRPVSAAASSKDDHTG